MASTVVLIAGALKQQVSPRQHSFRLLLASGLSQLIVLSYAAKSPCYSMRTAELVSRKLAIHLSSYRTIPLDRRGQLFPNLSPISAHCCASILLGASINGS